MTNVELRGERAVEVLVVGNTAYVDDDFCTKAFPGDHVQVVAASDAQRDEALSHMSWKELLQHLDQAYEFDRVVYLSTYLTPHTEAFGDIELLRSVIRACMGRKVQLLFVAGPAGAEGAGCDDDATAASGTQTGKGIIARSQRPVPLLRCSRGRSDQDPARAVPVYRVCRAGGSFFGTAVRRVFNRIGRPAGRAGCAVSPALCRGARSVGAPHFRQLGRRL